MPFRKLCLIILLDLSKREWIVYSAVVSLFIIIIGIGIGYIVMRNKRNVSGRNIIINEQRTQHSDIHNHQYLEIYDEIDESMMKSNSITSDSVKKNEMKLNRFVESVNIEACDNCSTHSSRNENTDYLQVYHESPGENSNTSSDSDNICNTVSEYLTPYQSFNERQREIPHGYDICVTIHNNDNDFEDEMTKNQNAVCVLKESENNNLCCGYDKFIENTSQSIQTLSSDSNIDQSLLESNDTVEKCKNVENKEVDIKFAFRRQHGENDAI